MQSGFTTTTASQLTACSPESQVYPFTRDVQDRRYLSSAEAIESCTGERWLHTSAGNEQARVALGHCGLCQLSRARDHHASLCTGLVQCAGRLLQPRPCKDEERDPDLVHCLWCCWGWSFGVRHSAVVQLLAHGTEAG